MTLDEPRTFVSDAYVTYDSQHLVRGKHEIRLCKILRVRDGVSGGVFTNGRYRVAKTHRIPYLYRSFSAKVTYI